LRHRKLDFSTAGENLSEDWDLRHRKLDLQILFGEEAQAKWYYDLSSDVWGFSWDLVER
jgi:hypothetical protein